MDKEVRILLETILAEVNVLILSMEGLERSLAFIENALRPEGSPEFTNEERW